MVIQEPEEQNRVKELEEQVRLLEWALAQAQLERHVLESVVAVADKELKMDLKKTFGPKSSTMRTRPTSRQSKRYTLTELCGYFGISRQGTLSVAAPSPTHGGRDHRGGRPDDSPSASPHGDAQALERVA
ncbi:MAG: hypothetical protein R2932_40460 [Caldilineaceae bacterium]